MCFYLLVPSNHSPYVCISLLGGVICLSIHRCRCGGGGCILCRFLWIWARRWVVSRRGGGLSLGGLQLLVCGLHWQIICLSPEVLKVGFTIVLFTIDDVVGPEVPLFLSFNAEAATQIPRESEDLVVVGKWNLYPLLMTLVDAVTDSNLVQDNEVLRRLPHGAARRGCGMVM